MTRRSGRGRQRGNNSTRVKPSDDSAAPNAASRAIISQPRYKPVVNFSRTLTRTFDIVCDGINPSLGTFLFSLQQLPDYTDFTNLFQVYKLTKIKVNFKPEYTELTDAALVSNAVNVNFNSAIDQVSGAPPATVDEVTQYQSCKSTGITKPHQRSFSPTMLTSSSMPCSCFISYVNPGERHYGFVYGIPPTGISMEFKSTITFYLQAAGAR